MIWKMVMRRTNEHPNALKACMAPFQHETLLSKWQWYYYYFIIIFSLYYYYLDW